MMRLPMMRFTQTHRVRPGRLAARLRVNVLLVISGLATSSSLCSSSFFSWSSARADSLRPPATIPLSQPSNSICITPSAVQARKLTCTYGSVLAADSRCILGEINEIRYRDRVRFRRSRIEDFPIIHHLSRRFWIKSKFKTLFLDRVLKKNVSSEGISTVKEILFCLWNISNGIFERNLSRWPSCGIRDTFFSLSPWRDLLFIHF